MTGKDSKTSGNDNGDNSNTSGTTPSKIFFRPSKPIVIQSTQASEHTKSTKTEAKHDDCKWEDVIEEEDKGKDKLSKKAAEPSKGRKHSPAKLHEDQTANGKRKRDASPAKEEDFQRPEKAALLETNALMGNQSKDLTNASTASLTKKTFGLGLGVAAPKFSDLTSKKTDESIFSSNDGGKDQSKETGFKSTSGENAFASSATNTEKHDQANYEVFTGEEDDVTLHRSRVTLRMYDADKKEWKQRGQGPMHVNITNLSNADDRTARVIIRNIGTLALLLNTPLFPGMIFTQSGERSLVFMAMNEGKMSSYAIQFENKQVLIAVFDLLKELCTKEGVTKYALDTNILQARKNMPSVIASSLTVKSSQPSSEQSYGDQNEEEDEEQDLDDEEGDFDEYTPEKGK